MKKTNAEIRISAKKARVPFWLIADKLGISETGMSRLMRHELSEEQRHRILGIIAELEVADDKRL